MKKGKIKYDKQKVSGIIGLSFIICRYIKVFRYVSNAVKYLGGNSESAVSKSNGIFTYETGSIVSRTAGVFSAFGSVVGLGFALVGITDIFDGVKTGGFNPFNVELMFAVGGGLVFIACAGMSYGFFKLAKYFDSKLES